MSRPSLSQGPRRHSKVTGLLVRSTLAAVCALTSLAALSCNEETPPPQPARFNRPNRVDFVCVNGTTVVPLEQCRAGDTNKALSAHALVTQAGRGEIAVVNLRSRQVIDSRRDIPGYTFIPVGETPTAIVVPPQHPGHTYVASFGSRDVRVLRTPALIAPVAELPDAQRVTLTAKDGTLVAPTDMVLAPDERALFVAAPDAGLVLRLPIMRCDSASAADCEDGLIDEAGITRLELPPVDESLAVEPSEPSSYQELCGFEARSTRPTAKTIAVEDLDEALLDAPARPSALALDAFCLRDESCTRRLLVADAAQPVIHAVDIDIWAQRDADAALLAPIVTGVPTKDVVVTPRVPSDLAFDSTGETQYVYGIDARDGSVLVIENGQVLNINSTPGQRTDRLLFDGGQEGALALEVMTPGFAVDAPARQYVKAAPATDDLPEPGDPLACRDEEFDQPNPARLRGVFLAVALTDGTIRVIDVHDMELRTNDGEGEPCRACPESGSKRIPLLVRNQQRLATSFVPVDDEEQPTFVPAAGLTFGVDGVAFAVRSDGSSASPRTPRVACIACDGLEPALPIDDDTAGGSDDEDAGVSSEDDETCSGDTPALLCVSNDPWSSGEDRWRVVFEGALPTAVENRGRFVLPGETGGLDLVTDSNPCAAGVLGSEDMELDYGERPGAEPRACPVPGETPELDDEDLDPSGDQVVIRSAPLDREQLLLLKRDDDQVLGRCATLKAELADNPKLRVAFEIRRAYKDRLVIREALVRPIGDAERFEDVRQCYEDTISFSVHTLDAFTVWGSETGFQHRVRSNAAGRCEIDPAPELALRAGRARFGCEFRNSSLQFKLGPVPEDSMEQPLDKAQLIGVELNVSFTSRAAKLVMRAYDLGFGNASVVTEQLRYNDVDGRLYLVDINDRGLVPIPLAPFPGALSSAAQFN